MSTEISFCPVCAGKLDASEEEQYVCEDCERQFFIQLAEEGDDDEDEEEEADKDDEDEEDEEDEDDE
jgi:hypothetical protein